MQPWRGRAARAMAAAPPHHRMNMFSGGLAPSTTYGGISTGVGPYGAAGIATGGAVASAMAAASAAGSSSSDRAARGRRASMAQQQQSLPAFRSAEEDRLVADFRRDNFELVQGLSLEWASCCLRFCEYKTSSAARQLQIYSDWRVSREVDMLGGPLNGGVRELLLSESVLLTGGRDKHGRPTLTVFAREIMGFSGPASSSLNEVRPVSTLTISTTSSWHRL